MAISILYNPAPMRLFEADGDFAAGAKGYFFLARTTTPLSVFTDAPLATPHTWPVIADAYGLFAPIYIAKGTEYKVRIEDAAGNILYAADGIDNPAEATGGEGGGGGLVVTASQIAQTGDFSWQPTTAERDGWVKANGKTIGPLTAISADTKGDTLENLFAFLWNTFDNTLCPVTPGGRGSNAAADWGGGFGTKAIATLDMRGFGAAGLDDMGGASPAPANRIQVTTTIGTTNTSTAATVPSTTGLCAGMVIKSISVPTGTTIVSINSATAITLSAAATVTNVASAARFSMFSDAVVPGAAGGENVHAQLVSEIAAHTHANTVTATADSTVHDPGHGHDMTSNASTSNSFVVHTLAGASEAIYDLSSGANNDTMITNPQTLDEFTGITVTTTVTPTVTNVTAGGGQAANIWTPTRLGTWFVKI